VSLFYNNIEYCRAGLFEETGNMIDRSIYNTVVYLFNGALCLFVYTIKRNPIKIFDLYSSNIL
jgi:hypothetical protein